jgi:hypothetical protein
VSRTARRSTRAGTCRGRLARSGGADPGQQQPLVAGERGDQGALSLVQLAAGDRGEAVQCGPGRRPGRAVDGGRPGRVEEALLGVKDGLAGVPARRVLGEHALAVFAAQLGRLVQQRGGLDRYGEPRRDRALRHGVGELPVAGGVQSWYLRPDEALGLGADVPHGPGGPAGCDAGDSAFG